MDGAEIVSNPRKIRSASTDSHRDKPSCCAEPDADDDEDEPTGVICLDDRQLVLGSERPPPGLVGKGGAIIGHHPIVGALYQKGKRVGIVIAVYRIQSRPWRDWGLPQVSQVMLTERASRS